MLPLPAHRRPEHRHVRLGGAVRRWRGRRVLRNVRGADAGGEAPAASAPSGDHFWPNTEHIMGWDIKDDGFGVVLSPELPALMRERLRQALHGFLERDGLASTTSPASCCIPAAEVLDTAEELLGLERRAISRSPRRAARLRQHVLGNGAVRARPRREAGASGPHLLAAFGPGFSAYFVAVDL